MLDAAGAFLASAKIDLGSAKIDLASAKIDLGSAKIDLASAKIDFLGARPPPVLVTAPAAPAGAAPAAPAPAANSGAVPSSTMHVDRRVAGRYPTRSRWRGRCRLGWGGARSRNCLGQHRWRGPGGDLQGHLADVPAVELGVPVDLGPPFGVVGHLVEHVGVVVGAEEGEELVRGTEVTHPPALAHDEDVVAQIQVQHAVGDHDDRTATVGQQPQFPHDLLVQGWVQPGGRLVESE